MQCSLCNFSYYSPACTYRLLGVDHSAYAQQSGGSQPIVSPAWAPEVAPAAQDASLRLLVTRMEEELISLREEVARYRAEHSVEERILAAMDARNAVTAKEV